MNQDIIPATDETIASINYHLGAAVGGLSTLAAASADAINSIRDATQAFVDFNTAYFSGVERAYLEIHKKLPGGKSNARLRKKRVTRLMAWAAEQNK